MPVNENKRSTYDAVSVVFKGVCKKISRGRGNAKKTENNSINFFQGGQRKKYRKNSKKKTEK